jgi:hypothetical protein
MKKMILVVVSLLCALATGYAQSKTPVAVMVAFNQKFPDAKKVRWEKELSAKYEADFKWNSQAYSASFDVNGEWLQTETHLSFNQLPEKVQAVFKSANKGAKVREVTKIETSDGTIKYEVEVMNGFKGKDIIYSEDGTVLKS